MIRFREIAEIKGEMHLRNLANMAFTNSLRHAIADHRIAQKYVALKAFLSPLGVPIMGNLESTPTPLTTMNASGFQGAFRGGSISFSNDSEITVGKVVQGVKVWLVGIECQMRQEKTDEVVCSIAHIIPSTGSRRLFNFPEDDVIEMTTGLRWVELNAEIYDGPPNDIVLACTVVEHDSGDLGKYKTALAKALTAAGNAGLSALGVPAEATATDASFLSDLSQDFVDLLTGWLGTEDDRYNVTTARISAKDILIAHGIRFSGVSGPQYPFPGKTFTPLDTSSQVAYNWGPVIATGIDDGGDKGQYAFYFSIEPYTTTLTL